MAKLIAIDRRSDVLTRPTLPCLSRYHTINLTAGCPYECRYCYARSFRSNPGYGKVHFYANTLDLLRRKLPNKRKKPELVYFSTACEPFAPFPQVLECLYGVMSLLLEHGASLLISTKSNPSEEFLDLFARYPGKVHIQVGLTTINDDVRRLLEPNAADVESRLQALKNCMKRNINVEVRSDPLTPELTDSEESFEAMCQAISKCGIKNATASHLFLRRGNYNSMDVEIGKWKFSEMVKRIYTHRIANYCGNSKINVVAPEYRRNILVKLKNIAERYGITLRLCRCKNPDVTTESCHPLPVGKIHQATLFN